MKTKNDRKTYYLRTQFRCITDEAVGLIQAMWEAQLRLAG